ncbi:bifunctional diguanylate cyclase/phosphodiesterase [Actibacterium sp. 188UL27-1]|uniref:putative bifunctional diguanylate cyclase/phosphodiesterase n=1 Tax=Actibacterium sp. 188UL27-1 TaxID=2786961 RepID=UPI0019572127|nr:EAL domain-containing protein [Actibacterium sp. 188UL27-1]MBM7068608.1 EAL domain-containing protein [Actibacterium sp. 188UL27-1]
MPLVEHQVRDLLSNHISDGIVIQDMEGHILWANAAYTRITGFEMSEILGRRPQEFLLPPNLTPTDDQLAAFRYDESSGHPDDFEIVENVRKTGERYWVQLSSAKVETGDGPRVVLTARDVTSQIKIQNQLNRARVELEHAVNFDTLTGLANRHRLSDFLDRALKHAVQAGTEVAVFHVDLDKFKEINDTHGHTAGDAVLVHAARAMEQNTRQIDLVARVGGDEFVIVMPDAPDPAEVALFAERIIDTIAEPVLWEKVRLSCGASIGISRSGSGGSKAGQLIQQADFALYDVKEHGRGAVATYDDRLSSKHSLRKRLTEDLRETIDNDGLSFFYQPILSLENRKVVSVEALARWDHPQRGFMSPAEFLPVAEEIGFLRDIDLSAMRSSVHTLAQIRAIGLHDIKVSFNASSHTLAHGGLVDHLKWAADQMEVPHSLLGVEVLETVFFDDKAAESSMAKEIDRLVNAGFPTVLDDFGVGYAGLAHLAQLNVTGIKIDRSLVCTILTDVNSAAIVRSIIRLAQELHLNVVAEGVESSDVADMLGIYGCTHIQGFGIARPMPLRDLIPWLAGFDPTQVLQHNDVLRVVGSG